ncbi:phosphatidylethanolamine N-methyltransferase, partial [Coemansia spiralis]
MFHTLGLLLIGFHVWSSRSVYETLGDFGWFYGDFFARDPSMLSLAPPDMKLYYTGIYRYLNNPDKVIGQAAFYGLALISRSWTVFALALLLQVCNFLFSAHVETPHMEKVYGAQVRRDSGIVRTVKKAVNKGVGQMVFDNDDDDDSINNNDDDGDGGSVTDASSADVAMREGSGMASLLASTARPVKDMILETRDLLSTTTARLAERTLPSELATAGDPGEYALKLLPGAASKGAQSTYYLGENIRVAWQAPAGHSRRDWIGIYPVTANFSNQITTTSSKGCYVYIHPDSNLLAEMVVGDSVFAGAVKGAATRPKDGPARKRVAESPGTLRGEALFSSAALPFRVGTYELRLHHGGTHAVLVQSKPFEITACDSGDIVRVLGCGDIAPAPKDDQPSRSGGGSDGDGDVTASVVAEDMEALAQALLIVANKAFAVTDSRAMAVVASGDVAVQTDVIEPLLSVHDSFAVDAVLDEKQARRFGYAIKEYFGVEFSPDVLVHAAKHHATVHD